MLLVSIPNVPLPLCGCVGPGSVSEAESAPSGNAVVSNAVRLRVAARREAALRDMLAFASDGEGMDGPQVICMASTSFWFWRWFSLFVDEVISPNYCGVTCPGLWSSTI